MASEPGIIEVIGDALYAYAERLGMDPGMIRAYGAAVPIRDALQSAGLLVTPELIALRELAGFAVDAWRDDVDEAPDEVSASVTARTLDSALSLLAAAVDALDATTGAGT